MAFSEAELVFLALIFIFTLVFFFEFLKKHHLPVGQVKNRIH